VVSGGFLGASLVEKIAHHAAEEGSACSDDARVVQWQQPDRETSSDHGDDHDIKASAELVHRFDDMQVVIAQARLYLNHHGDADEALVAKVDGEGEGFGDVVSPECGAEGQKGHQAEEEKCGDEGARFDLIEQIEELMLKHPEARGKNKCNDEGNPVAEGLLESLGELAVRDAGRNFDFENEQGHDDGEDGIAEGFEPVLAVHGVTIVLDCARERKRRVLV